MKPRLWPIATVSLTLALVVAFALDTATRVRRGIGPEPLPALWVFDGANPKPWQFVTYAFVHAFRTHLSGNLMLLLPASLLCEWRLGAARVVGCFFGFAFTVSTGFWLLDWRDLYGASGVGSAFGVLAAALWLSAREFPVWIRGTPAVLALLYFGVFELWPAIQGRPSAGHVAHAVGAVAGGAVGWLLRDTHR